MVKQGDTVKMCPSVKCILKYFERLGETQYGDALSALTLFEKAEYEGKNEEERLRVAAQMCRNMQPDTEDLNAVLFGYACHHGRIKPDVLRAGLSKEKTKKLFITASKCAAQTLPSDTFSEEAAFDYFVMIGVCDKIFKRIVTEMEKHFVPDTACIIAAYRLAKEAHCGVLRQSGEPYLNHPLSVTQILAEIGVESSVIAAALLHDIIEDTDFRRDDITQRCGEQVAKLVDAVTSVHRDYAESHKHDEYSRDKAEMDARSFEKLVRTVEANRRMVFALYIKAADRIHNLSTIDVMSSVKKHHKIDETQLDYLPLFKRFGLRYFVRKIDDLTWKIANPQEYLRFSDAYDSLFRQNEPYIRETRSMLEHCLNVPSGELHESMRTISQFEYSIAVRRYLPQEVYSFVRKAMGDADICSSMIGKDTAPLCDLEVILDSKEPQNEISDFASAFVKLLLHRLSPKGVVITDLKIDTFNRFVVMIKSGFGNRFRLTFMLRKDYLFYNFGSSRGIPIDMGPYSNVNESMIVIKLRNGKKSLIAKGATVLDVAFSIHPDIGITARAAKINNEDASIYSVLHDGDTVEVFADTERQDGVRIKYIPHVRISWLEHVVTKEAKRQIVKTLENRYGDADPADTHKAQDAVVGKIAKEYADVLLNRNG